MDWVQFSILFLTMVGFLWAARRDAKDFAKETKDFHGRLCTLEEKYIQMMERMLERK